MNLKLWQKRERFAELVFTAILGITVAFTFIYDKIKIEKNFLFIVMGLLEASLLVLIFSRAMNMNEMRKNKEDIRLSKIISFILYCVMFGILGYYFILLR